MAQNNFNHKLDYDEVLRWVKEHPGVTLLETKTYFHCESRNVRDAMGWLYHQNEIIIMPHGLAIAFVPRTGKRGRPNVKKLRDTWVHFRDEATGKYVNREGKFERLSQMGEKNISEPQTEPRSVPEKKSEDNPFDLPVVEPLPWE